MRYPEEEPSFERLKARTSKHRNLKLDKAMEKLIERLQEENKVLSTRCLQMTKLMHKIVRLIPASAKQEFERLKVECDNPAETSDEGT